jgi:UDP-N-acetylmuramoyl-tripeptide--D-alanyl-D-alanine ligase
MLEGVGIVIVNDTVKAINDVACAYASKRKYKKIAVTGSVGKTTTKEFVSVAFGNKNVHKTQGNFNSTIGMPLSLMSTPTQTEIAVLEMGMSGRGEIKLMSETAKPDIAIITNIGSSHIEMLGSREGIRDAKLEIVSGLDKNGVLLINGDDPMLTGISVGVKTVSVGIYSESCDFRAVDIVEETEGTVFSVIANGRRTERVFIPVLGNHNVYAALFAYASAILLGETEKDITERLSLFEKPKMRQNIFEINGITIIEDCYNASPESMKAALEVQAGLIERRGRGRSIALLGNMLELGSFSRELHRDVGVFASQKGLQKLVTFGELASFIADASGIEDAVKIEDTSAHEKAAEILYGMLETGDILLVKASRGVAAEKIIEILKERLK